jgi:HlyD family secretion protein
VRSSRASIALLVLALGACRRAEKEGEATASKRTVRCAPIEATDVTDAIALRGTIAALPDRDAQVAPQVTGRLLQVLVREGDKVTAGQVVARVDDALLADEARAAEAALGKTRAEVENAEATLARTKRVFEHGIAARQEVDDATARAHAASAAQTEAEATAHRLHRQVERAAVRSPLSGVVVKLLRRPGELVDGTPATPVVEVADPSRLELVADAPAADLVRVVPGATAEVTVAALPNRRWAGTVTAVSPGVDRATGLGTVRIGLDLAAAARPPIGLLGTAQIQIGGRRRTLVVPRAAVRGGAGAELEIVLCGSDGRAHVRRIERGVAAGDKVEAQAADLAAGALVAVEPVIGLADGEAIEVAK